MRVVLVTRVESEDRETRDSESGARAYPGSDPRHRHRYVFSSSVVGDGDGDGASPAESNVSVRAGVLADRLRDVACRLGGMDDAEAAALQLCSTDALELRGNISKAASLIQKGSATSQYRRIGRVFDRVLRRKRA